MSSRRFLGAVGCAVVAVVGLAPSARVPPAYAQRVPGPAATSSTALPAAPPLPSAPPLSSATPAAAPRPPVAAPPPSSATPVAAPPPPAAPLPAASQRTEPGELPPPIPSSSDATNPSTFIAVTGVAAALTAAAGTVLGFVALSDAAAYRRNPTTARADAAEGTALAADLCFGMAVTLGVTTLVLLLLPSKASSGRKAQYGTIVTF